MAKIDACKFPTYEEMGKKVAEKALDEFLYNGRSIREWMQIIVSEDCISRQAVLALAKEECDTAIIPYRKFVKDVNALPPVIQQPKTGHWIPVSEKLPKPYQPILVTTNAFYWANEPVKYFVKQINFGGVVDFIAWMPLPEPYKEESEVQNDVRRYC